MSVVDLIDELASGRMIDEKIITYLFAHPLDESSKTFYSHEDSPIHDWNLIPDLLAFAINYDKLGELSNMVEKGLVVTPLDAWCFAQVFADWDSWKILAKTCNVAPTCFLGAYDYDTIPFVFYEDMINDLGVEECLRAGREDPHDFNSCIEGYVNVVLNARDRQQAKKETGLKCPLIKQVRCIDMREH